MLDILMKMAGLVKDAAVVVQGQKDRARRRQFGKSTVTFYLRLLEVIEGAERVLHELEFYERRFREHLERNDDWQYHRWGLSSTLHKQGLNLIRLGWALKPIREEMSVLAPQIAAQLEPLVEHKRNVLSRLAEYCGSGTLPLRIEIETGVDAWIGPEIRADLLETEPEWREDTFARVKTYLQEDAPQKRIQRLKEIADSLREFLTKTFTLEEVLWSTEQFRDETEYLF